jgi:hypothetical protein
MSNTFPATPESSEEAGISDRQQREIEYHRGRAAAHVHFATERVNFSAVTSTRYRWWNAYWVILRKAKNLGLTGKNVLVVGCGFGDDAIQLAYLGRRSAQSTFLRNRSRSPGNELTLRLPWLILQSPPLKSCLMRMRPSISSTCPM